MRVVDGPPEPIAEPVQAGLRLGRPAPRVGAGHGDHPAHRRVVVRPVPEPEADPGPGGRGGEPRDGGGGRAAVRRAVRRLLAHRPLPRRPRRSSSSSAWPAGRADAPAGPRPTRSRAGWPSCGARPAPPSASSAGSTAGAIARSSPCSCLTAVTVQLKEGNIKRVFWQTPPLHLPRDWERRTRSLSEQLERLSIPELVERERNQGPEGELAAIECHRCPWGSQSKCDQAWKGIEALEGRLGQKRETLDAFRNAYWQEFLPRGGRARALRRRPGRQAARQGAAHRRLPPRQRAAGGGDGGPGHPRGHHPRRGGGPLLLPDRGIALRRLRRWPASSSRSAPSSSASSRRWRGWPTPCWRSQRAPPPAHARRGLHRVHARRCSVGLPEKTTGLAIVEESFGGHEGDLIRALRRLIDLLRQLAEAPEVPAGAGLGARPGGTGGGPRHRARVCADLGPR